ncbi:unnamed protein product, partial [Phaeothamnion confervicola]
MAANVVISACADAGRVEAALAVLALAPSPSIVGYNACIAAVAKRGDWHAALRLLAELLNRGLAPTERTYGAAVHAC